MRVFYIFLVKDEIKNLYNERSSSLFNIFKQIYYMRESDVVYASNLFFQLINKENKYELDKKLFLKMHNHFAYSKNKEQHIFNDLYKDEISILLIKRTHIILTTSKDDSTFFEILNNFSSNYFICDFLENDYFWLNNVKKLVEV